jgi:hypothetical protein
MNGLGTFIENIKFGKRDVSLEQPSDIHHKTAISSGHIWQNYYDPELFLTIIFLYNVLWCGRQRSHLASKYKIIQETPSHILSHDPGKSKVTSRNDIK